MGVAAALHPHRAAAHELTPDPPARRRRRRPEEAEAEILASAARLLRKRPLHEITVEEIMRGTTLSRKSFYVYFSDRYAVVGRLFQQLRARLDEGNRLFLEAGDPVAGGRAALVAVARIAGKEGAPMRALWEAAQHDRRARKLWREFNEPVVAAVAARIRVEVDAARVPAVDATAMARALVGMNYFMLFDQIVGNPKADVDALVDAVFAVWSRTLRLGPQA